MRILFGLRIEDKLLELIMLLLNELLEMMINLDNIFLTSTVVDLSGSACMWRGGWEEGSCWGEF